MKKFLALALAVSSLQVFAAPKLENLSEADVGNISREFAANFAHTTVSAPETEGAWGIEVGLMAGRTGSPDFKGVIEDSGGDGDKFTNLYHAGLMARAHFMQDIFAELVFLPSREVASVDLKNYSAEVGWNFGSAFSLPVDLSVALNYGSSEIEFTQKPTGGIVTDATINLESKTMIAYVGVSKTFLFFTPYAKVGVVKGSSEFSTDTVGVLEDGGKTEDTDSQNSYLAFGGNAQFALFKIGAEISQLMRVNRASMKISLDF